VPAAHCVHTEPPPESTEPAAQVHVSVAPLPAAVKPEAQPHVAEPGEGATAFAFTLEQSEQLASEGAVE